MPKLRTDRSHSRRLAGYRAEMRAVETPGHPSSRDLLAFWNSRSNDGKLLSRQEIPAREIAHLMGNIQLMSPVDPEGSDWLFRLVGSNLVSRFGGSPEGQLLSQTHDSKRVPQSLAMLAELVRTRVPRISRGRFVNLERDFYLVELVHLPILGPDRRAIWVLGGIFFFN